MFAKRSNPTLKFAPSGRWDAPSARPLASRWQADERDGGAVPGWGQRGVMREAACGKRAVVIAVARASPLVAAGGASQRHAPRRREQRWG